MTACSFLHKCARMKFRACARACVSSLRILHRQHMMVYQLFSGQRDFVRALTNLAEALRSITPDQREAALHVGLEKVILPTWSRDIDHLVTP